MTGGDEDGVRDESTDARSESEPVATGEPAKPTGRDCDEQNLGSSDRRTLLQAAAGALTLGLAGCSHPDETREFGAEPARLTSEVEELGYGLVETSSPEESWIVNLGEVRVESVVENRLANYRHGSELAVVVASTPVVEDEGQSLNPTASAPLDELLGGDAGAEFVRQLGVAGWERGPRQIGERQASMLDEEIVFETFVGVTRENEFVLLNVGRAEPTTDAVLFGTAWKKPAVEGDKPFVGDDGYVPEVIVTRSVDEFIELLPFVRYGETPGDFSEPGYQIEPPQILADPEEDALWKELSVQLVGARADDDPLAVNDELLDAAESVDDPALAATFEFWAAENLRLAGRYEAAISGYDDVLASHERGFLDVDLRSTCLRKRAFAAEQSGRIDEALATYDELAAHGDEDRARAYYWKGQVAEEAGWDDVAVKAYEDASAAEDPHQYHLLGFPEMARRAAERVSNPFDGFYDDATELAERLAEVFENEEFEELQALASLTHFTAGPASGCKDFVDREPLLERLVADAQNSEVSVDVSDVTEAGKSVYLHTEGWDGTMFTGEVDFQLGECPRGWEWCGVGFREVEEALRYLDAKRTAWDPERLVWGVLEDMIQTPTPSATPTPTETPTQTPTPDPDETDEVRMHVSAPWEKGTKFRAGGLPWPVRSGGGCGTGVPGFYYDFGPTHTPSKNAKYAIDFVRYGWDGLDYVNKSFRERIFATNGGYVTDVVDKNENGSDDQNHVIIEHPASGRSGVYTDYISRYLHLTGPNEVPVSEGQYVVGGMFIGRMDNTGNSALHHLHFNIRKGHNNESAMPTPMAGERLEEDDNGKCIESDTVEMSVIQFGTEPDS